MSINFIDDVVELSEAVDAFAAAMKKKLYNKAADTWDGWKDAGFNSLPHGDCTKSLNEHAHRLSDGDAGQSIDVANYCMFLWNTHCREDAK